MCDDGKQTFGISVATNDRELIQGIKSILDIVSLESIGTRTNRDVLGERDLGAVTEVVAEHDPEYMT